MAKIGIIGGSGLENPEILKDTAEEVVKTPYGNISVTTGRIAETEVVLISRHGKEHTITPSNVNYRANISALKAIGCSHIIATTAVGSLKEEIQRGDLVILDQFIDFTKHRKISFYDEFEPNIPLHTPMANPFSEELRNLFIQNCKTLNIKHHEKGTVITIEGPRFSTKAESKMFRAWGADVINMSIAPEATLANEAGIPYIAIAMSTDYDCWKEDELPVSWESVLKIFGENVSKVTKLIVATIPQINNSLTEKIKSKIRTIPNWPKQGVMYRDITTLLKDPVGFNQVIDTLTDRYRNKGINIVAGIESRGFIIGAALANRLGVGFVPIRKKGKLPAEKTSQEYSLEYGTDTIEVHTDAIIENANVLLCDDLIATGGTATAACQLVTRLKGNIVECCFIVGLPELGGRKKLEDSGYKVFSLVDFEGE